MRLISITLAAMLALAACSPGASQESTGAASSQEARSVHPVSGLSVIDLTVAGDSGSHKFRVEVAASDAEQARGLMFRTQMGPDEGMLFPKDPPERAAFWMKNTVIPLDIIFVGRDGRILNIENAVPYDETPVPAAGLAAAVLELNGGRAAELGIVPGDKVSWKLADKPRRSGGNPLGTRGEGG